MARPFWVALQYTIMCDTPFGIRTVEEYPPGKFLMEISAEDLGTKSLATWICLGRLDQALKSACSVIAEANMPRIAPASP
jgi:hypothetical protein